MSKFSIQELSNFLRSPSLLSRLTLSEWADLILILRESKLLATLYHILLRNNLFEQQDEYVKRHLNGAFVHADRQKSQVIYESLLLTELLNTIDVKPIFLKGANYTLRNSINSHGRIISDIDILVQKSQLVEVEALLKRNLWQSETLSDYDEKFYRKWAHEIPPLVHILRSTVLDVHHNLYMPISGRALNIELFELNSEFIEEKYRVLSRADSVLHSILHLFLNEDFTNSFRDLFDIYCLINEYGDEEFWQRLTWISSETNSDRELYYCITLLRQLFDYSVPENVYQNLKAEHENSFSRIFVGFILINALTPQHELLNNAKNRFARFVVFIRGHWIKMPLNILIFHLFVKSYKGLVNTLFGKHFLEKD